MNKVYLGTSDLTSENIDRIADLFPQTIIEAPGDNGKLRKAVDFDALRQELSDEIVEGPKERYQFTWPGKQAAKLEARRPINKTLRPCRAESVDFDTTQNLYIEGDNLDALKLLRNTYAGKVKMIYIDPPYNTGHDFIYSDDYSIGATEYADTSGDYDEHGCRLVANLSSNGRFHSDWCSMMYSRLLLARDLLSNDGAIFISIDDNEVKDLRNIGHEVFGDSNFVATFIWQKRYSRENREAIGDSHEYILVYARDSERFKETRNFLPLTSRQLRLYSNPDNDPRGPWQSVSLLAQGYRPNQMYEIIAPNGNVHKPPTGNCWKIIESEYRKALRDNRVSFGSDGNGVPRRKQFLSESKGLVPWTWLPHEEVGHTGEAKTEIRDFLGNIAIFDTPKPVRLIERLLQIASKKDSIILDFFSGSATTAHAVMKLNAEDGGNRKSIMVQLPEATSEGSEAARAGYKTIADIGKERIRRAGRKIVEAQADLLGLARANNGNLSNQMSFASFTNSHEAGERQGEIESSFDIGFRVLKIDSSNFVDAYASPEILSQQALELVIDNMKRDRSPEDLLFEVLPTFRIELSAKIETHEVAGKQVFNVSDNQMLACFDTNITTEVVEEIAKLKPIYAVFRDASFADDSAAANFEELFKTYSPDTVRKVV
jgi:adenine-specific DNA-methyltransferase